MKKEMIKKLYLILVFWILFIILLAQKNFIFFKSHHKHYKLLQVNDSAFVNIELLKSLFEASNEQTLINKNVLLLTLKFMIEERDEDDPEVIELIRSLIVKPSGKPVNLNDKNKVDHSQLGQSIIIDSELKSQKNGFFVEAGALDGEHMSNSLYFELAREWTGILIEPVPSQFNEMLKKNRNAFAINACIANRHPIVAKFRVFNTLSGRMSQLNDWLNQRIDSVGQTTERVHAYVPCFSLYSILKAINVETVDYFSLDVEGGEFDVLSSIDFNKIKIKSLTVEHNNLGDSKAKIVQLLTKNGFKLFKEDDVDVFFHKIEASK